MTWWQMRLGPAGFAAARFSVSLLLVEGGESASNPYALPRQGMVPHRDEPVRGLRDHLAAPADELR